MPPKPSASCHLSQPASAADFEVGPEAALMPRGHRRRATLPVHHPVRHVIRRAFAQVPGNAGRRVEPRRLGCDDLPAVVEGQALHEHVARAVRKYAVQPPLPRQCAVSGAATRRDEILDGLDQLPWFAAVTVDGPEALRQRSALAELMVDRVIHETLFVHPVVPVDVGVVETRDDLGWTQVLEVQHRQLHSPTLNGHRHGQVAAARG